ncbi:MAG: hypothetical protein AB1505_23165 [Candidatus Latescibacterota bacterium]
MSPGGPADPGALPAGLLAPAMEALRQQTGIVIPVYFARPQDAGLARALLEDTVAACLAHLGDPGRLCLSADGEEYGGRIVQELAQRHGVEAHVGARHQGKLQALRDGVARLWARGELRWVAVLDMDGDHFANELANLVRAAQFARQRGRMEEVLVVGRRTSRHRPMGFLRGELEELADRVLLDALAYRAALDGVPLRLDYATAVEEYPDFHSGYKLFSRRAAQAAFLEEPRLCGASAEGYFRHGCEAVMVTEALQAGAQLVLVNRSTLNEQPVSSFGLLDRTRMVADKMIWPCRRLGVPAAFADQWLRHHLVRLQLATLVPQGREELVRIRQLVLEGLGAAELAAAEVDFWGPLFV